MQIMQKRTECRKSKECKNAMNAKNAKDDINAKNARDEWNERMTTLLRKARMQ